MMNSDIHARVKVPVSPSEKKSNESETRLHNSRSSHKATRTNESQRNRNYVNPYGENKQGAVSTQHRDHNRGMIDRSAENNRFGNAYHEVVTEGMNERGYNNSQMQQHDDNRRYGRHPYGQQDNANAHNQNFSHGGTRHSYRQNNTTAYKNFYRGGSNMNEYGDELEYDKRNDKNTARNNKDNQRNMGRRGGHGTGSPLSDHYQQNRSHGANNGAQRDPINVAAATPGDVSFGGIANAPPSMHGQGSYGTSSENIQRGDAAQHYDNTKSAHSTRGGQRRPCNAVPAHSSNTVSADNTHAAMTKGVHVPRDAVNKEHTATADTSTTIRKTLRSKEPPSQKPIRRESKREDDGWDDDDGFGGGAMMENVVDMKEKAQARSALSNALAAENPSLSSGRTSPVSPAKLHVQASTALSGSEVSPGDIILEAATAPAAETEATESVEVKPNVFTNHRNTDEAAAHEADAAVAIDKQIPELNAKIVDIEVNEQAAASNDTATPETPIQHVELANEVSAAASASRASLTAPASSKDAMNAVIHTDEPIEGQEATTSKGKDDSIETITPPQVVTKPAPWRSSRRTATRLEDLDRQGKALLNKLTIEKFPTVMEKLALLETGLCDQSELDYFVDLIVEKAVLEPEWSEMYADVCMVLHMRSPCLSENGINSFRVALIMKIQKEFQALPKTLELTEQEKLGLDDSAVDLYEKKVKNHILGIVKLIGELYQRRLLAYRIVSQVVSDLVLNTEEPNEHFIECFLQLVYTTGYYIDQLPSVKPALDLWFGRLKELQKKPHYSKRLKCVIQDVLDLRNVQWLKKIHKEKAKGLSDMRGQVELEDYIGGAAHAAQYGKVVVSGKPTNSTSSIPYAEYLAEQTDLYQKRKAVTQKP